MAERRAIDPLRYIVPGGSLVMVPAIVCRFLIGHVKIVELHAKYRGMRPEIDAVVDAIRMVDLHAQRSALGTAVAPSPEPAPSSTWYSTSEAAGRLGVTDRAVRKWCATGRLPAVRIAGRWQIAAEDLNRHRP